MLKKTSLILLKINFKYPEDSYSAVVPAKFLIVQNTLNISTQRMTSLDLVTW